MSRINIFASAVLNVVSHGDIFKEELQFPYCLFQGMVQADGEPLASQFVPRCFGVIQKIAVEEHWKYWNSLSRTWYRRQQNKTKKCLLINPIACL